MELITITNNYNLRGSISIDEGTPSSYNVLIEDGIRYKSNTIR